MKKRKEKGNLRFPYCGAIKALWNSSLACPADPVTGPVLAQLGAVAMGSIRRSLKLRHPCLSLCLQGWFCHHPARFLFLAIVRRMGGQDAENKNIYLN